MTSRQASHKTRTKRKVCAEWASRYTPPVGEEALQPALPRAPRAGHAWDAEGREVKLVIAKVRRKLQVAPVFDDLLVDPDVSERTILTGEEEHEDDL